MAENKGGKINCNNLNELENKLESKIEMNKFE